MRVKAMKRRFTPVIGLAALVLAVVLTAGTLTPSTANEDNGFTEHSLREVGDFQLNDALDLSRELGMEPLREQVEEARRST
jgi:hypothetical protein